MQSYFFTFQISRPLDQQSTTEEMESWFDEEGANQFETYLLAKLAKNLKRSASEESGYASADTDMVTGKFDKSSRVQIASIQPRFGTFQEYDVAPPTTKSQQEEHKSKLTFLDISNSLLKCSIDSNLQPAAAASDNVNSKKIILCNSRKYDRECCESANAKKSVSVSDDMNQPTETPPNPPERRVSALILDFESSPEVLSQTEISEVEDTTKKDRKSSSSGAKTSTPPPSTSDKKKDSPQEEPVVVPSGKSQRRLKMWAKVIWAAFFVIQVLLGLGEVETRKEKALGTVEVHFWF